MWLELSVGPGSEGLVSAVGFQAEADSQCRVFRSGSEGGLENGLTDEKFLAGSSRPSFPQLGCSPQRCPRRGLARGLLSEAVPDHLLEIAPPTRRFLLTLLRSTSHLLFYCVIYLFILFNFFPCRDFYLFGFHCLEQCLAHSSHSVDICALNESRFPPIHSKLLLRVFSSLRSLLEDRLQP